MGASASEIDRRKALWDSMLDAEMNQCYWEILSARYSTWDRYLKFFIAFAASGAVAGWGIWSQYPGGWKVFSAVAAIAAVAHPFFVSSEALKRMSELVATWKEVFIDYELLWYKDGQLQSTEAWSEFETIKHREAHIDETRLPGSKRLLEKAFSHVLKKRGLTNG